LPRRRPPTAKIRIVEIAGLDRQACGGTHLASTGQSRPVRVLKIDNKGRHNRHAIRLWGLWARAFNALVVARRGDIATGLPLLRDELNRAGDARFLPRFLPLLGELAACFGEAGHIHLGLDTIDNALARCDDRKEHWYRPELLRIKGELMLKETPRSQAAEACFREATELTEQQGAGFWQLRCAISMARFAIEQGRRAEALAILEKVCGSLSEGSDIADMRIAHGLIAELQD
jgi:predicted ATPase